MTEREPHHVTHSHAADPAFTDPASGNATQRPKPPVDASMTLLNEVMHRPLDPGYATAARRKAREEALGLKPLAPRTTRIAAIVLAIVLGFVTVTAVVSLRSRAPLGQSARNTLIEEIKSRNTRNDALEASILELSQQADSLQEALLSHTGTALAAQIEVDQTRNGTLPVSGPGFVVTLHDGADAEEQPENRVQDTDIRAVVSGLWGAGAEAVAVNGKRLTATSAIRSAGDAILVDLTGLSDPYVIEAIGNPRTLEVRFAQQAVANQLTLLRDRYGIDSSTSTSDKLELAAGTTRSLLNAKLPKTEEKVSVDRQEIPNTPAAGTSGTGLNGPRSNTPAGTGLNDANHD